MIDRDISASVLEAAAQLPAVTLTGPRQSGKTTLCRHLFPEHRYVTLEAPDARSFATSDPRAFLAQFPAGAILDEVQRTPDLLSYLQGIIDDDPAPGRWILTGSRNLSLMASVSQSLAGRTAVHNLLPLTYSEVTRFSRHPSTLDEALLFGGYPRIFDRELSPASWLRDYVATYLDRDVRSITNVGNLETFRRFLELCAGRTAQLLNLSSLAKDCGVSQPTAKSWLSVLEASFIAFRLPAFHSNLRKRLVKMPKLHFYDTGLACWLLGIREPMQIRSHPLRGAIFETWMVSEVIKHRANQGITSGLTFYRDSNRAESDLVIEQAESMTLLEAKSSSTPSPGMLASARRIRRHLANPGRPCRIAVAYGGEETQQYSDGQLIPWRMLADVARPSARPSVYVTTSQGEAIPKADILALFPNKTWKRATTAEDGWAILQLHTDELPMTLFIAAPEFTGQVRRRWNPDKGIMRSELLPLHSGGSVIFPTATGYIPGLAGRLEPVLDKHAGTYLYAENIAINGGMQQPVHFDLGEELQLADAEGNVVQVRIVDILGRSALIEYRALNERIERS